jgi:hypothetical protein
MSEKIVHISDTSFEQDVLKAPAGADRLLGGVVGPVRRRADAERPR